MTEVHDYQAHEIRPIGSDGPTRPLPQPSGDLLIFHTEAEGTRFAVRPSGTEPKIKFYLFARTPTARGHRPRDSSPRSRRRPTRRLDQIAADLEQYVDRVVKGGV